MEPAQTGGGERKGAEVRVLFVGVLTRSRARSGNSKAGETYGDEVFLVSSDALALIFEDLLDFVKFFRAQRSGRVNALVFWRLWRRNWHWVVRRLLCMVLLKLFCEGMLPKRLE